MAAGVQCFRELHLGVEEICRIGVMRSAWHWGLSVGLGFYEVTGMGQSSDEGSMTVVGPSGVVASTLPAEQQPARPSRIWREFGPGPASQPAAERLRGGIVVLNRHTKKTDDEITEFVVRWVDAHTKYSVASCNCQHFVQDFYRFLSDVDEELSMNKDLAGIIKDLGAVGFSAGAVVAASAVVAEAEAAAAKAAAFCAANQGVCATALGKAGLLTKSAAAAQAAAASEAAAAGLAATATVTAATAIALVSTGYLVYQAAKPHNQRFYIPNLIIDDAAHWRYDDINVFSKAAVEMCGTWMPWRWGTTRQCPLKDARDNSPIVVQDRLKQALTFANKDDAQAFCEFYQSSGNDANGAIDLPAFKRQRRA